MISAQRHGDVNVICGKADADNMNDLRTLADLLCDKLENGVVILAAVNADKKVNLVAKASQSAVEKGIHAGKIIKETAQLLGGNGGGRPNMAQAGGKFDNNLVEAFKKSLEILDSQIGI